MILQLWYLIASRIPPGHIDFLLGCWVVVLLSSSSYCKPPTTPTTPTTPIRPTNHKHQKTKRKDKKAENAIEQQKSEGKSPNWPKFGLGRVQNGAKMQPKWEKRRATAQNDPQMASRTHKIRIPRRFLTIFGSPLEPPNRPKTRPWQKMGSPESVVYRFLCFSRFFSAF